MERLSIDELIAHCDRQLERIPSGNIMYQEHESVRAYLQILRHYLALGTVDEFRTALLRTAEDDKAREEGRLVPKMVECPKGWKGMRYTRYHCPNCNKVVRNDESFCHKCGQAILFPKQVHDKENNRIVLDFTRQEAEAALGGGEGAN